MCGCDPVLGYKCLSHASSLNYKPRSDCVASYLAERVESYILEEYVAMRIQEHDYERREVPND